MLVPPTSTVITFSIPYNLARKAAPNSPAAGPESQVSIAFVFATVITTEQLSFIREKNAGFKKEHVVVMPIKDFESIQSYPILKNELLENPDILYVTASRQLPSNIRFKQN